MDIQGINQWFEARKDAVLVTDKTNDPVGFSQLFVDKKRLKMELFTWSAVLKGQQTGIDSAMPNGNLLHQIKGQEINHLKNRKITEIVASRKIILKNKELFKDIKNSGIKVYAYHINSKNGLGERAVMCNENNYIYGIYANNWSFGQELNCNDFKK